MTTVAEPLNVEEESQTSELEEQSYSLLEKATRSPERANPPQYSKGSKLFILFCLATFLAFFTVLAVLLSGIGLSTKQQGNSSQNVISNANKYILDPLWDYNADPTSREYEWTITDETYNPDGVFRPMMLVNRQFPGPLIECNDGDTLIIHVHNKAENATSIHWHGLFQQGTPWMDGTVGISQCPIVPGSSFAYKFKVQDQSGTYWWHSHQAVQTADGLFGPLIVHTPNERTELQQFDYASDRVVMMQDYYHDSSASLLMAYLASDRENAEPVPDGALINGQNIRDCSSPNLLDRKCDNTTSNVGRPILDLEPGKRHRLRIINTGVFAEFQIQLDEHEFAVTEADGTALEPAYFHRLLINPAQRYSIIVNANHSTSSSNSNPAKSRNELQSFWLRSRMITSCFAEENPALEPEARAILRYQPPSTPMSRSSLTVSLPNSTDWPEAIALQCSDLNSSLLHPISKLAAPSKPDALIPFRTNFEIGPWRLSRGFINSSSWLTTDIQSPTLHRAIEGFSSQNASFLSPSPILSDSDSKPPSSPATKAPNPSSEIGISPAFPPTRELTLQTPPNTTIDLLLSNFDDGAHPFHLHGHVFWVLAIGVSGYPPAPSTLYPTLDLRNPLRRDTATIPAFGWMLLRFRAQNVGMWAFHCHVSWHAEAGLRMQVMVGGEREIGGLGVPVENWGLCRAGKGELEKGVRPGDGVWVGREQEAEEGVVGER
ncbi:MAG: hypothetical protein Q9160_003924 [Pyrenula sp. 1 TL-2023]